MPGTFRELEDATCHEKMTTCKLRGNWRPKWGIKKAGVVGSDAKCGVFFHCYGQPQEDLKQSINTIPFAF